MAERAEPRSGSIRKAETLAKLQAHGEDVWVASTDAAALPYLVPLSLAWIDERVVIALQSTSRTARNIRDHGVARLGLGPTRDVVLIDAVLDRAIDAGAAPADFAQRYADQAEWDPRPFGGYIYLVLRPERIQAWREENELAGRTVMRNGAWLV